VNKLWTRGIGAAVRSCPWARSDLATVRSAVDRQRGCSGIVDSARYAGERWATCRRGLGGWNDADVTDPRDIDAARYETNFSDACGLRQAYVREGTGGVPLVCVHGWPESKRIFWKVIGPLAGAGFDVIAPDLRVFGDSDVAPVPGQRPYVT